MDGCEKDVVGMMLDYGRLDVPGGSEVKDASISWPSRNQKKSEKIMHEK